MDGIKLIVSDLDYTLVSHKVEFSEKIKQAINKCHENNIEFVLCSARPTENLINIATSLRDDGVYLKYIAAFNGCEIYDLINETYVYREQLSKPKFVAKQLDILGIDYLMYYEKTLYASNPNNELSINEANSTKLQIEPLTQIPPTPKVVALVQPDKMTSTLTNIRNSLNEYTVTDSAPYLIEITNKGSNKGTGIIRMTNLLDISLDNIMCFGDSGNDLSMFKVCKKGIAVANATEEIKLHASEIIDSVVDDGVAKYILKHLR